MAYPLQSPYLAPAESGNLLPLNRVGAPPLAPNHSGPSLALPGQPGVGNTGIVPPNMSSGLPAQQVTPIAHSIKLPPQSLDTMGINQNSNVGATNPLLPRNGPTPNGQVPGSTPGSTPGLPNILSDLNGANVNPAVLANQYMASILGQDNPYIRDARQRGMEQANARGMLNSSMSAGSAERSAIEAAQPLFNAAMGLNQQRENQGWQTGERISTQDYQRAMQQASWNWQTGERVGTQQFQAGQNQADRELKQKLQSDAAFQQDWLSSQNFSRQFNGALSMLPITTSSQFMQTIQQYAIENPEIYTPEMISGMNNFFTQSMSSLLAQFFPNTGGA